MSPRFLVIDTDDGDVLGFAPTWVEADDLARGMLQLIDTEIIDDSDGTYWSEHVAGAGA